MKDITELLRFNALLQQFRTIERTILVNGTDRCENDAEHCFMLAMLAWNIVQTNNLSLDMNKIFRYCLAHDLVEAYAGDMSLYDQQSSQAKQAKVAREHAAAERLRNEFPQFAELHESIVEYEKKEDPESRFVYALDKLHPVLNIYADGGRTWRKNKTTLQMIIDAKASKVAIDPTVAAYFAEMIEMIKREEARLF